MAHAMYRHRDMGSEENAREEVGCGGNENVKMDDWTQHANENSEGQRTWHKYPGKCMKVG